MAFTALSATDVDADSPITDTLMDLIRTNLDDLDTRLTLGTQIPTWGDGSDGAYDPGATGNILSGVYNYTTAEIDAAKVMTVSSGSIVIIYATTSITINGELNAKGLGASGGVTGNDGDAVTHFDDTFFSHGGAGTGGGGAGAGGDGGVATYFQANPGGTTGGGSTDGNPGNAALVPNLPLGTYGIPRVGTGGGATPSSSVGGDGGGCIILISPIVTIGASGVVDADGSNGTSHSNHGGGGGGGGMIAIITKDYTDGSSGGVHADGGAGGVDTYDGGAGGAGLVRVHEV